MVLLKNLSYHISQIFHKSLLLWWTKVFQSKKKTLLLLLLPVLSLLRKTLMVISKRLSISSWNACMITKLQTIDNSELKLLKPSLWSLAQSLMKSSCQNLKELLKQWLLSNNLTWIQMIHKDLTSSQLGKESVLRWRKLLLHILPRLCQAY
jgi:hypothetical protein